MVGQAMGKCAIHSSFDLASSWHLAVDLNININYWGDAVDVRTSFMDKNPTLCVKHPRLF